MSCCDNATVQITNNTLTTLTVVSVTTGGKTKLNGISAGDSIKPDTSKTGTASSVSGSNGEAEGVIAIAIGTEANPIYLNYCFNPKDTLGHCPCTTDGTASPPERGKIAINVVPVSCEDDKKSKAGISYTFNDVERAPLSAIIVGAGAGGVFTAYELYNRSPNMKITLLEARDRIGGNVESVTVPVTQGGQTYNEIVDAGAQFFSKGAQPNYCNLLANLGFLNDPSVIISAPAGVSIWNTTENKLEFKIPASLAEMLKLIALNPLEWIYFGLFIYNAWKLNKKGWDDETTVKQWVDGLDVISNSFKNNVILPFLYQFDTVDPDTLDDCNAWYTVTYLADSLQIPTSQGLFIVLNCLNGLQWILQQVLGKTNVVPKLSDPVVRASWSGAYWDVTTQSNAQYQAETLIFAIDGPAAHDILQAGGYKSGVLDPLSQLQFARLPISLQEYQSCFMPGDQADQKNWEAVNILSSTTKSNALQYQFTVYFGALRPPVDGSPVPIFKSWGNPDFDPQSCTYTIQSTEHPIMVPTSQFLETRDAIADYQGNDGLWFAGAWTNWFDSQEAALNSAAAIVDKMYSDDVAAQTPPRPKDYSDRADALYKQILEPALAALPDAKQREVFRSAIQGLISELKS